MKAALLAILLLLTPHLCAQDVNPPAQAACVTVISPQSCRIGELVRLDASQSVADSISWILVPESVTDIEVYDSGRRAVFSARTPGDYRFIVACAKDGTVDVKTFTIHVASPPARPQTQSLAEWVPFWLYQLDLPTAEAHALSDAFSALADDSTLQTPGDWSKATKEAMQAVLGDSITDWTPLLQKIATALDKRAQEGTLSTPEEHRAAWLEIAEGLRNG